jgi:hypothetical protein
MYPALASFCVDIRPPTHLRSLLFSSHLSSFDTGAQETAAAAGPRQAPCCHSNRAVTVTPLSPGTCQTSAVWFSYKCSLTEMGQGGGETRGTAPRFTQQTHTTNQNPPTYAAFCTAATCRHLRAGAQGSAAVAGPPQAPCHRWPSAAVG